MPDAYFTVIPGKRSATRDPWDVAAAQMDRMGPGSAQLRCLAGMTVEGVGHGRNDMPGVGAVAT
jgi:hypothetical protein